MRRTFKATRHPGIYAGSLPGTDPDRWMVSYRISGLGQRTRTFEKQADAVAFQAKLRDPLRRREVAGLTRGRIRVSVYLEKHLARRRDLKPSTRSRYEQVAPLIASSRLGGIRVAELTRDDVETWVGELLEEGTSPGSIEKALSLLRSLMQAAMDEGMTAMNPARAVRLPRREQTERFVLSAEQVVAISEEVPERHRTAILLMGFLGLRIGEVSALQVRDVDLLPEFGATPIGRIGQIDVQRWVASMADKGLAPGTIRPAYYLLSKSMKAAVTAGIIQRSPCVDIALPKLPRNVERRIFSKGELRQLIEAVPGEHAQTYRVLIGVLAFGGLRWSEAIGLRRKHCDLPHGRLSVEETMTEVSGHHIRGTPKSGKSRTVVLPAFVVAQLSEHVDERVGLDPDSLVFTAPDGGPLFISNFRRDVWDKALKASGLGHARIHDLRHTCASLMIQIGAHPKAIQQHLGHSTIELTMNLYGHLFPEHMDDLAEKMDAAFSERTSDATEPNSPLSEGPGAFGPAVSVAEPGEHPGDAENSAAAPVPPTSEIEPTGRTSKETRNAL